MHRIHTTHRRRAFSLVELMIGMIILGFGLLMIGAVLPIAWRGSVETSELTRADGATRGAKTQIQLLCRVDGMRDLFNEKHSPVEPPDGLPDADPDPALSDGVSYSFLGDWDTGGNPTDAALTGMGSLVHVLHVENWAADAQTAFLPDRNAPGDLTVPEAPILIDPLLAALPGLQVGMPSTEWITGVVEIGAPAIRLLDRVFPNLPSAVVLDDSNPDRIEALRQRRFAWGALHRLTRIPQSPTEPRQFMMYYVTLRRGEVGSNFARQSPDYQNGPEALGSVDDVVLPVAWRVPLTIVPATLADGVTPTGVPAVAYAGDSAAFLPNGIAAPDAVSPTFKMGQVFPVGAIFVDESNGQVYRVADREYLTADDRAARLTLDVAIDPIDFDDFYGTNRWVWVYPPPVLPGVRTEGGPVEFSGYNPVVSIRTENLTLMP